MDAAQVIHERQAALLEHEALDREATIRDIQIMYEELGDLVDEKVIEKALDEYLSQRHAFTPARPGLRRQLALLYIRRGWVTKRVLVPAAMVGALVWGGFALTGTMRQRALDRDTERLRAEVVRMEAVRGSEMDEVRRLLARGTPADLPETDAEAFANHLAMAEGRLAEVAARLDPIAGEADRAGLTRATVTELGERADLVESDLGFARSDIIVAGNLIERHARLGTLESEVEGLHAAVLTEAVEELALERAAGLRTRLSEAKEERSRLASRLAEMEDLRDRFEADDWNGRRSRFDDGLDVNALLLGFMAGRHSSGHVHRMLHRNQHFLPVGDSGFSSGGSFGGGGFSSGGGFGGGGGGFSTGGGF